MIKSYKKFISEKISVTNTDSPSIASVANQLNKLEEYIKEFSTKKTELLNIYTTSSDEKDLVSKLSARKYINPVNTKSEMNFSNPLLAKYASVCDLRKQVIDLEKEKESLSGEIKNKESDIQTNPGAKKDILDDISAKRTDIERVKTKLQNIKQEADRLERLTMKELQDMQNEITLGTREVRKGREKISAK